LIAIGFTSGLDSIACSVVDVSSDTEVIWCEVMPGPRKRRDVTAIRRYHAHKLMFDIIFDRWPPAVIAIGPPSAPEEPLESVVLMRTAMFELGRSLRVPVVLFDRAEDVGRGLGAYDLSRGNGLKSLVKRRIESFTSNKKRVVLATATAMAGALQIKNAVQGKSQ
jgi:hypothetical protein